MFRDKVLHITNSLGIDKETALSLRRLKTLQRKSMAQIVKELVYKETQKYDETLQRMSRKQMDV